MRQYRVVLPLTAQSQQHIAALNQQFMTEGTASLSKEAGQLMSDVACQIIDEVFGSMVVQFVNAPDLSDQKKDMFRESLQHIEEIKGVMRKYMTWAISLFGNERLKPAVAYFNSMIECVSVDGTSHYSLVFPLSEAVAQRSLLALTSLQQGQVDTAEGAFESLVEVTDVGVDTLIKQPKDLLKFNFVVNKTLNGVIGVTTTMAYKSLRRFGKNLDPVLFHATATHFQRFLKNSDDCADVG